MTCTFQEKIFSDSSPGKSEHGNRAGDWVAVQEMSDVETPEKVQ